MSAQEGCLCEQESREPFVWADLESLSEKENRKAYHEIGKAI